MSEPAHPSLDQGGKSGFEGLASGGQGGSFELHFTSGGDAKQQLTEEQQPPYRTFKGEQQLSARTSSEEISLLERGRPTSPSSNGKVRSRRVAAQHGGVCRMYNIYTAHSACAQTDLHWPTMSEAPIKILMISDEP